MMASAVSGYINAILKNAFDRPLTHFGRDISQLAHVGCKVVLWPIWQQRTPARVSGSAGELTRLLQT